MIGRRGSVVIALAAAATLALPLAAAAQQPPAPGLAVTTPSEALAAAGGVIDGVAEGAADLREQVTGRDRADRADTPYAPALTRDEAISLAEADARLTAWVTDHPIRRTTAELQEKDRRWKVSFVGGTADDEVVEAEVYVSDETGDIAEVRTGPQVAWMMARGYEGAFGRAVNRWRIWIPLSVVFLLVLLPITRPRHLLSWRTLDLLALLSFTVSWAWFNEGDIFTSVPLQYPPLLYLLARMAWITVRRARVRRVTPDANPGDSPSPRGLSPGGGTVPGRGDRVVDHAAQEVRVDQPVEGLAVDCPWMQGAVLQGRVAAPWPRCSPWCQACSHGVQGHVAEHGVQLPVVRDGYVMKAIAEQVSGAPMTSIEALGMASQ